MNEISNINDLRAKATQGDIFAQKQLGMLLIRSDETLREGFSWLEKAATADTDAMYMLGKAYLKRLNDAKQAFAWYERAAQNNHIDAMNDVGACYLFGYQVEQSTARAIEWYKRAASTGSPVAYHNLGFLCYQNSELYETAVDYFKKATELGYADSAYMLGIMYLQGLGVEKDAAQALEQLTLSYRLGKHYACRPIGDLYFQGAFSNGKQEPDKALEWYLCGMEHDVLSCIEVLGDCYYHGFGVEEDLSLAYDFYKAAAEKGSTDAAFILGTMFIRGENVKKDLRTALKWMLLAERGGNKKAPQFIKMINEALESKGPAAAPGTAAGGAVGIQLRASYSASVEAVEAEQRAREAEQRKKNAAIFSAAGAMSGDGAVIDYEMGAVIGADGEVSYVNTELGIILGADGSVSSHDANSGLTYNWSTGTAMAYNEGLGATMDLNTGHVSYNLNSYIL